MQRRAKKTETTTAVLRRWWNSDRSRAVVEINSKYGGVRYVVVRRANRGEYVISRHRKRHRAFKVAEGKWWAAG